jgi:putative transposase
MTEAFPWDIAPRYLLRDRDKSYGPAFRHRVRAMGITEVITAPRSPWQNPTPSVSSVRSAENAWITLSS